LTLTRTIKYLKLSLKWLLRLVLGLVFLFLLLAVLLQFSPVQTRVSQSVISRFSSRTGTEMSLQKISIRIPFGIGIKGLYVEDTKGDTLLYAGNVKVDVNMFALLKNRIKVSNVFLDEIVANITRLEPDTVYSYAFIINSLSGKEKSQKPDTIQLKEPARWSFELGKLEISNARVRFADHFSGIDLQTTIGGFSTAIENFNPADFSYNLGKTAIKDTHIALALNERARPSEDKEKEPTEMDLGLRQLEVDGFTFDLNSHKGLTLHTDIDQLLILSRKLDITRQQIEIELFSLDGLLVEMKLTETEGDAQEVADQLSEAVGFRWAENFDWYFLADKLEMRNAEVAISTPGAIPVANTFDAANFRFSELELLAETMEVSAEKIRLQLSNLKGRSGSDFRLNRLSADIDLGETLRIDDLNMETALSLLQGSISAGISLLEFPLKIQKGTTLNLNISRGRIGADLAFFVPDIRNYLKPADRILFAGSVSGTTENLKIDTLWAEGPGVFKLSLGGRIKNLLNIETLEVDLPQAIFAVQTKNLGRFFPAGTLPENIALPDSLKLMASAKGNMKELFAEIDLNSSFGDLELDGTLHDLLGENPAYDLELKIKGFDAGKLLLREEMLGPVFAEASFAGKGMDPQTMEASFNLLVSSAVVKAYEYTDFHLNGGISDGVLVADFEYLDDNFGIKATNQLVFASLEPHIKAQWQISHMNFHALNFSEDQIMLRTVISADLQLTHPDFAVGSILVYNAQVLKQEDLFTLVKLEVNTSFTEGKYIAEAISPILNANYGGSVSPLKIPELVSAHFASLMGAGTDTLFTAEGNGNFEFDLQVLPSPWITEFLLSDLSFIDPFLVKGNFDGQRGLFSMEAGIPFIGYGDMAFHDFALLADSRAGNATFSAKLNSFEGVGAEIRNFSAEGLLKDNTLSFDLAFDDRQDNNWLALQGNLKRDDERFLLSFEEDMLINKEPWQISPGNQIVFGKEQLLVEQFRIGQNGQYLLAQSQETDEGFAPIHISFHQLDLGQFFTFDEEPSLGGVLQGSATINQLFSGFSFVSDLTIDRFTYKGNTIGDIHLLAQNPVAEQYTVSATIKGNGNDIEITGDYQAGESPLVDLVLQLKESDLSTFEGFTAGQLTNLQGQLTGNLTVKGKPASPAINGSLRFSNAAFLPEYLNAYFRIENGQINIDQNTLGFQNFTLLDSLGRKANLGGTINFADFSDIRFNLSLNMQNFLLMNVAEGRNELFSGRMLLDSDLSIRGGLNNPVVQGRLKLNEGSFFNLILPQSLPEAIGDEGVVEFVSRSDTLFVLPDSSSETDLFVSAFRNLNLSVNIEIDPQTDVNVLIDEYAGDYLEVKGGGVITLGIDPGGRISLAGRYEISEGSYLLTFYDVIRRNFRIQRGSSILLTGDPMQSRVNITAIYSLRTSARELFESPVAGAEVDPALRQQYNFQVFLKMSGELLNPDISFEIGLPPGEEYAMEGRLQSRLSELSQNESDLNKQVFALLMMGSFVQDNPLASLSGGGSITSTARSSGSRVLAQQLNRLSEQYIRGLNLNFDIESYEDYTGGEVSGRTELQVDITKNFFDERLRLTMGGNFELEDETRRQSNLSDIAGDFLIEYLLNPRGSLILRGFRKKEFRDVFEGQVIETGVSLLFNRSYNNFRELFMKKEKPPEVPSEEDEIEATENGS
jgi:hypothetical protein